MQLIWLRGPKNKTRTINLKVKHIVFAGFGLFALAVFALTLGLFLSAQYGDKLPLVQDVEKQRLVERQLNGMNLSAPLDALAIRLANLQAQVARLNAIGNRLLDDSNVSKEDLEGSDNPGQGGVFDSTESDSLSLKEVTREMNKISNAIDRQADIFSVIDTDLRSARVEFQSAPNGSPLANAISVSRFGPRIDPFTGRRARHHGVDYVAPKGTPIYAAAAGVVVRSAYYSGYGYTVDIEHKNSVLTRYAHSSKLLVEKGDIVRMGQKIALVGSTGRSTGPHLHFEVRVNGVPRDPKKFVTPSDKLRLGSPTMTALNGLLSGSIE